MVRPAPRLRQVRRSASAQIDPPQELRPRPRPKPIYVYPGLLRYARQSALYLDSVCPASMFKCPICASRDSEVSSEKAQSPDSEHDQDCESCDHVTTCAICIEDFHEKDIVRHMPCDKSHVFHSRCILQWFKSNDRCPLCNDEVNENSETTPRSKSSSALESGSPTFLFDVPSYRIARQQAEDHSNCARVHRSASLEPPLRHVSSLRSSCNHAPPMRDMPEPDVGCPAADTSERPPKHPTGAAPALSSTSSGRCYSYIAYDPVRMKIDW